MKKITSLLILLSIFLMPIPKVYAAEIGGTINEVLIPTQSANRNAVLYIPVSSCNLGSSNDFCRFYVDLNGTRVSSINVTTTTPKVNNNNYYQLTFDYSRARTKGGENTIVVTTGSTSIQTVAYTPKEKTIVGSCGTQSSLVTEQGIILTRRLGTSNVEKYYELISIVNAPGNYDVVAGTGIEFPISIYYTYQGTNKDGVSFIEYDDFIDNNPLSMYVGYLPDKIKQWYPTDNEAYRYKIPYQNTLKQKLSDEIFIQTTNGTEYTTAYYTDQEAIDKDLIAAGYKKLEGSCRTEYKWKRTNYTWEGKTDNSITNLDKCKDLNDDPDIKNAALGSDTTCYQKANKKVTYSCLISCGTSVNGPPYYIESFRRSYSAGNFSVYTSSCDVDTGDCNTILGLVKRDNPKKYCSIVSGNYSVIGAGEGSGSKKISCSKDNGCSGRVIERKTITFCHYDEKQYFTEYYIGSGNWSKVKNAGIWTIERPENTYPEENITNIGTRQTCRYYRVPSGDFGYQTTELRKYELPETFIESGTSYIYDKLHAPSTNVTSGGRRLYTDLKASNGILNIRILGNNIGMNKYKYDTSCNYNMLANGLFNDGGGLIIYRPVDPKDPFPRYAPLANWRGKAYLIRSFGPIEYQVRLSSADIQDIRNYNSRNPYLDFNFTIGKDKNGNNIFKSNFIHKNFSKLFK